MIEIRDFFRRAEEELVGAAVVNPSTYAELGKLSLGAMHLMRNAVVFVHRNGTSGQSYGSAGAGGEAYVPGDEERIAAVRLMLLELKLHTTEPAWSSELLTRAVDAVLAVPNGTLGDLLSAVFSIFADYPAALSSARANFIKDLVVECFTRHRSAYNAVNWEQFANRFGANASASQLYLGFLAIPPERLPENLVAAIASGLENMPYHDEVLASRGDITA